jgi:hypothetical protein
MDGLQIEESKRDQIFELRAGQNVLVFVGLDQVLEAVEFFSNKIVPRHRGGNPPFEHY